METLILKPIQHNQVENIGLYFPNIGALNKAVRTIKNARWSNTHKCWYIPLNKKNYEQITAAFKNRVHIESKTLRTYLQEKKKQTQTVTIKVINKKAIPEKVANKALLKSATPLITNTSTIFYKQEKIDPVNAHILVAMQQQLKLKAYSPSTIKTYLGEMAQLLKVLKNIPADDLSPELMKRYLVYCYETLKLSENTLHSRTNAMKFYYEQVLGREKFFWEIPRPKKPIKLPKVISEEKIIEGLVAVENLKHRTILLLAYSAGLRVSEVVSLKVTDINSDRMQITINNAKGKKDRVVTLSKAILPLLREYYKQYKPKKWLFEGQFADEHYSSRSAQIIFKDAYKALKLPPQISFHSLRHSYATHLLENGTDIAFIQKLLGHNDIKTTLRYAQVSNKEMVKIESPLDKIMRRNAK